jgi:hypothetical protein
MALRLFGGGFSRLRSCPACEEKIAAEASFCPSCYMVFRPDGAVALREHLRGGRVPTDVYLLRKLQTQDPDAGPVERRAAPPPQAPAPVPPPPPAVEADAELLVAPDPLAFFNDDPEPLPEPAVEEIAPFAEPPATERELLLPLEPPSKAPPKVRTGAEVFFRFGSPLPPPTRTLGELPRLLAWMLENDPVIPNNLSRLDTIHAETFAGQPAGRLSYEEHLQLQIADDLALHPTQDSLDSHLHALLDGYRQAAEDYHGAASGTEQADGALWRMSSAVSRIRVEAWVYRTLFAALPGPAQAGRRRRAPRASR